VDRCPDEPGSSPQSSAAPGCPRFARLRGSRFVIVPPLSAQPSATQQLAERDALGEVAFTMRATPRIGQLTVEVRLPGPDPEAARAHAARERAARIVRQLVRLGVNPARLRAVGMSSQAPAGVTLRVTSWSVAPGKDTP
jgi:hypothetical protein